METRQGRLFLILSTMVLASFLWAGLALAGPVPDTGQTTSYAAGDDGFFTINPHSYTKLDVSGNDLPDSATSWTMVRDNTTGLIWEVKQNKDGMADYSNPNDADNTYTWYNPDPATNNGNAGTQGDGTTTFDTQQYIDALNATRFGAFSDWRMPTAKELSSLVDSSIPSSSPAINAAFFPNTNADNYWTKSACAGSNVAGYAWLVKFSTGYLFPDYKHYAFYTRAVRGPITTDTFIDNHDGTVTDTSTGLMWQKATAPGTYTWQQALTYAENLNFAGYNDWRLPNWKELQSLVDYTVNNPSINSSCFSDTATDNYWSSTTDTNDTSRAWFVRFLDGYVGNFQGKSYGLYVRLVRGGECQLSGHLIILSPAQGSVWKGGQIMPIKWDTAGLSGNVSIAISTQGGKNGTFESVVEGTENNGVFNWAVESVSSSFNCVLRIEPITDPDKGTTQGFFTIGNRGLPGDLNDDKSVDLKDAILALQVTSGITSGVDYTPADVNGDKKIGLPEEIYILEGISGLRSGK